MLMGTDARREAAAAWATLRRFGAARKARHADRPARGPRGLASETGGVAAVEFALLLPLMVLLYAGAGELSEAVMTSRKVELLSRTLADLGARQPTYPQATSTPPPANAISQGTLVAILDASTAIMAPGSLTPLKMTLSAVDIVNNSAGQCCSFMVRWSYTQSGTLRPCQTPLQPVDPKQAPSPTTISSALGPPLATLATPISLLIADVSYVYQGPFSSQWIDFSSGMSRTSYMLPRAAGQVILQGPISPTGTQSGAICY